MQGPEVMSCVRTGSDRSVVGPLDDKLTVSGATFAKHTTYH